MFERIRELYLKHDDRLFDRNVRLFLGARKGGVNAGIRDTIDSDSDRPNFWAYNNGVTFVCDSYSLEGGKLTLTNFSIVNGCQTTVSIANSSATAARKVRVAILKRGAKFFVLATMAIILHARNGKTFLNKLKGDIAVSKRTGQRLKNYATMALEWYVEAMQEVTNAGTEVSTIVRSQDFWSKIRQKIEAKWKVYNLAKNVVEDALPKL